MTERAALELDTMTIRIPIRLQRRGGRKLIMTPEGVAAPTRKPSCDETLVKALVRAHRWRRRIESGHAKSITDLAEQDGVIDAYICRLLPLTCLAPEIVEAILDGRQPKDLRLAEMLGNGPVRWDEQRGVWGLASAA
jgi:ParB-like chromosome segregation protein Spo0J